MIAFLDVAYGDSTACAACILAHDWTDSAPARELTKRFTGIAPYESGQFYKRELPALLGILAEVPEALTCVVVDGYVWLGHGRAGLGAHLHGALGGRVPVVGVAKTAFAENGAAVAIHRGKSSVPLFVTSEGMDVAAAAKCIEAMHGPYRLPSLLKRVDALCRVGMGA